MACMVNLFNTNFVLLKADVHILIFIKEILFLYHKNIKIFVILKIRRFKHLVLKLVSPLFNQGSIEVHVIFPSYSWSNNQTYVLRIDLLDWMFDYSCTLLKSLLWYCLYGRFALYHTDSLIVALALYKIDSSDLMSRIIPLRLWLGFVTSDFRSEFLVESVFCWVSDKYLAFLLTLAFAFDLWIHLKSRF